MLFTISNLHKHEHMITISMGYMRGGPHDYVHWHITTPSHETSTTKINTYITKRDGTTHISHVNTSTQK